MLKVVRLNAETYPVEPDERSVLEGAGASLVAIQGKTPEQIAHLGKLAPLERLGRPEDVAGLVAFRRRVIG